MSPRHSSRPVAEVTRLTEKQYQRQIEDLAHMLGYATYHTRYSLGSDTGYPDLTMWRPATHSRGGRTVWAEVKGPRGHLSDAQNEILLSLRAAGNEVYVWYSEKHSLQEIADILRNERKG